MNGDLQSEPTREELIAENAITAAARTNSTAAAVKLTGATIDRIRAHESANKASENIAAHSAKRKLLLCRSAEFD
jgi:hypothetical protein